MSNPRFKSPIVAHFIAADGNCYPLLLHYLVECDGSEPAYVVTEPDVLSMDASASSVNPATYNGGGDLYLGACPGSDSPSITRSWESRSISGTGTATTTPVFSGSFGVRSFTVSVEAGRANVTLASGNVINIRRGSRTWTADSGDILDGLPVVRGTTANADFDVVWEEL